MVDLFPETPSSRSPLGPRQDGHVTFPHSKESLRKSYSGLPLEEVKLMIGENALRAYNFDMDALARVAERIGPAPGEIDQPLTERPAAAHVGTLGFR